MPWQPLPLVGGSNADDAEPFCAQEYVNWLPAPAETPGTLSEWMLKTPPGLQHCLTIPDETRWRGMRNVEGRLFGVVGQSFVQMNPAEGSHTVIGTVTGGGRCSITHNQITNGNEVAIGNGTGGYVYNTVTGEFGPITDSGFPGFLICDYINSLVVGVEPKRRFFFCSELAAATSYSTINRFESEASPDRLRSLIVDHRELWLLNERTVEIFAHTGNLNSIFENKQIVIEQGCAATHSVCKLDNSVFWLGNNGQVYRANGYTPQRTSTRAMEQAIARCDLSKAYAYTWVDRGFAVYYLTFPDGETWGYDCAASARAGFPVWHKRRSANMDRWRLSTLVEWEGNWYGGEYNSGRLMRLDWDYVAEGSDDMVRIYRPGVLHANQNRVRLHGLEFVFDTGHISEAQSIVVSPAMADQQVNATVSHQYEAEGGTAPYTFSVSSGYLPTELSMTSAGLVTGTVKDDETVNFAILATDANGNTGELVEQVRVTPYYLALQVSESGTTANRRLRTIYAKFNEYYNVYTELASYDVTPGYPALGSPGFVMDGKLVTKVRYDNDSATGAQQSGVYVLEYNGTSSLVKRARWQKSATQFNEYYDILAYDDDTIIVLYADADDGFDVYLGALTWDGTSLSATGTALEISATQYNHVMCKHGAYLIVLNHDSTVGNRSLKAYSWNGSVFALLATYGSPITGSFASNQDELISDGSYIYLPNGMIFTFNGSAFALVTTAPSIAGFGGRLAVAPGRIVLLDGTTTIRHYTFAAGVATQVQTIAGTYTADGRAICLPSGYYLLPSYDVDTDTTSGMYFRSANTLTRMGKLEVDNDDRATGQMVSIALLTEALG